MTKIGIAAIVATALTATPAYADFYDGANLPPDKDWQIQTNLRLGENVGITVVPKYIRDDGLVTVLALGETDGTIDAPGFGVGYRLEIPQNGNTLSILPMVQGAISTEAATGVPTVYVTEETGKWTLDARAQVPITFSYAGNINLNAVVTGMTVGYQATPQLRVGLDVEGNLLSSESTAYGALLRYDLAEKGKQWMELHLATTAKGAASSTVQYRINF
ncbi:hypothetical protein HZC31_03360 [Candidatus Woesearchaeota archaeon]|nr:hypothetical protein [Candidatus Woesearchaeota archaeon]